MPALAYMVNENPTANNWAVLVALAPNSPTFTNGDTPEMIVAKCLNALVNSFNSGQTGSVVWGQIGGTLANQADLQAALNARLVAALNLADLTNTTVARTNLGLGTAATRNVPATGDAAVGEVVLGSDTRLTGARTPLPHAPTHNAAGSDPITISQSQVTNLVSDLASKLAIAANLSDLASAPVARSNLGATVVGDAIFTVGDPSAVTFIRINADNTVTLRSATDFLNDILPSQTGNAGKFLGTSGTAPSWEIPGMLGSLTALNLNAAAPADTPITITGSLFVLRKVMVTNASTDLSALLPVVEIRDAPAGGGNLLATIPDVGGFQTLDTATKFYEPTLATFAGENTLTAATLYARLTTAAGSAATCDLYLFGDVLA